MGATTAIAEKLGHWPSSHATLAPPFPSALKGLFACCILSYLAGGYWVICLPWIVCWLMTTREGKHLTQCLPQKILSMTVTGIVHPSEIPDDLLVALSCGKSKSTIWPSFLKYYRGYLFLRYKLLIMFEVN